MITSRSPLSLKNHHELGCEVVSLKWPQFCHSESYVFLKCVPCLGSEISNFFRKYKIPTVHKIMKGLFTQQSTGELKDCESFDEVVRNVRNDIDLPGAMQE